MKTIVGIIVLFVALGFTLKKDEDEKPNIYKVGDITLSFYDYWDCTCSDSCSFAKKEDKYFVFSNETHFNDAGYFKVKYSLPCDSIQVFQRTEYAYGVLNSETEGVTIYDSTRLKKKKQEKYVSYSGWSLVKSKNKSFKFNIKSEWEGKTVKGPLPTVSRKAAEDSLMKWRTAGYSDPKEVEQFIKENEGLGLFVNGIEMRLKIFLRGQFVERTFYFPFRHGEC